MTIQITRRASLGLDPGAIRTLATATEAALVADREAIYSTTPNPAGDNLAVLLDPTSGQIVLSDGGPIAAQVALSALVSAPGNVANLLAPGLLSGVIYDAGNRAVQWTIDGVTYSASYSSAGITVAGTDGKITNISVDPALRITSVAPA